MFRSKEARALEYAKLDAVRQARQLGRVVIVARRSDRPYFECLPSASATIPTEKRPKSWESWTWTIHHTETPPGRQLADVDLVDEPTVAFVPATIAAPPPPDPPKPKPKPRRERKPAPPDPNDWAVMHQPHRPKQHHAVTSRGDALCGLPNVANGWVPSLGYEGQLNCPTCLDRLGRHAEAEDAEEALKPREDDDAGTPKDFQILYWPPDDPEEPQHLDIIAAPTPGDALSRARRRYVELDPGRLEAIPVHPADDPDDSPPRTAGTAEGFGGGIDLEGEPGPQPQADRPDALTLESQAAQIAAAQAGAEDLGRAGGRGRRLRIYDAFYRGLHGHQPEQRRYLGEVTAADIKGARGAVLQRYPEIIAPITGGNGQLDMEHRTKGEGTPAYRPRTPFEEEPTAPPVIPPEQAEAIAGLVPDRRAHPHGSTARNVTIKTCATCGGDLRKPTTMRDRRRGPNVCHKPARQGALTIAAGT